MGRKKKVELKVGREKEEEWEREEDKSRRWKESGAEARDLEKLQVIRGLYRWGRW